MTMLAQIMNMHLATNMARENQQPVNRETDDDRRRHLKPDDLDHQRHRDLLGDENRQQLV